MPIRFERGPTGRGEQDRRMLLSQNKVMLVWPQHRQHLEQQQLPQHNSQSRWKQHTLKPWATDCCSSCQNSPLLLTVISQSNLNTQMQISGFTVTLAFKGCHYIRLSSQLGPKMSTSFIIYWEKKSLKGNISNASPWWMRDKVNRLRCSLHITVRQQVVGGI